MYNLTCPSCDGFSLFITNITMDENRAEVTLTSNAVVNQSNPVLFTAGQQISLDIGFEATSEFDAIIKDCVPD